MKRFKALFVLLLCWLSVLTIANAEITEATKLSELFPDAVLAQQIAARLGVDKNSLVTQDQLNNITTFGINNHSDWEGVKDWSGLRHLKNLTELYAYGEDGCTYSIEELSMLTKLKTLHINFATVSGDFDSIVALQNLENFDLSAVVFSFLFILIVGYSQPKIAYVAVDQTGSAYNQLIEGDIIKAVNGKEISVLRSFDEISIGDTAVFTVIRDDKIVDVQIKKYDIIEQKYEYNGEIVTMTAYNGFGFVRESYFAKVSPFTALKQSVPFTGQMSVAVLKSLGMIVAGKVNITQITGPVGTIDTIANYTLINWRNLFLLLPLIAANLGIFNLLPIPALDGSKIIFAIIEWIRKKPINRKVENTIHAVGLVILFSLVIIVDIIGMILRG